MVKNSSSPWHNNMAKRESDKKEQANEEEARAHQKDVAIAAAEAGGIAHARETAKIERASRNWKVVGNVAKSPFMAAAWVGRGVGSGLGSVFKYGVAYPAIVTGGLAFGSGVIDHIQDPPEDKATILNIIDNTGENLRAFDDRYQIVCHAEVFSGQLGNVIARIIEDQRNAAVETPHNSDETPHNNDDAHGLRYYPYAPPSDLGENIGPSIAPSYNESAVPAPTALPVCSHENGEIQIDDPEPGYEYEQFPDYSNQG